MPKQTRFLALVTFLMGLSIPLTTIAQRPDAKGSKDHPLISRFDGFYIAKYQEVEFDQYILPLSSVEQEALKESKTLEGKVTRINYQRVEEPRPSLFQMYKTFEEALKGRGAELLYSCQKADCGKGNDDLLTHTVLNDRMLNFNMRFGTHGFQAHRFSYEGKQYYTALFLREEKNQVMYELHVIELEEMDMDKVTVANIEASLEETGAIAFYEIYFDFGKSSLKSESAAALQTMADYLKQNPDQQFFIVGHTDNVGNYQTNLTLSQARAAAVLQELKSNYSITGSNIEAVGIGPVAPVASNQSEDGRARNRRVELVIR